MDPFERLGLKRAFLVDRKALERNHRELSKTLHPDRYVSATPAERKRALSEAADVNEAFRIVRDPIRRAEALFAAHGIPVGEANEPKPPPSFLMEMMELREELDDARRSRDLVRIERIRKRVGSAVEGIEAALDRLFPQDGVVAEAEVVSSSLHLLGEYRFFARARETLSEIDDADASGP